MLVVLAVCVVVDVVVSDDDVTVIDVRLVLVLDELVEEPEEVEVKV